VSINTLELKIYLLSSHKDDIGTKASVTGLTDVAVQTGHLCPEKYVAAAYNNDWYIGCIIAHNDEECDILVTFMERKGQYILIFLQYIEKKKNIVWLNVYWLTISSDLCLQISKNFSFTIIYYEEMFIVYLFKSLFFITPVKVRPV
jgi:hypothetical protein